MENVIYRGRTSSDELVYGPIVTREYCVTIADGEFRDIMDEEGKWHVVFADTVELKIIGKSKWIKLPSEYAEQRERAYRKYYTTNEEWFCQLPTEEKAKVLRRRTYGNSEDNESVEQGWVNWLKAKHEDNPPDIPSVPSWDKWLEGERTKCIYCDGNGVECDLYGRSECPKTPKTEQEYIQTCNTEQLAEWLRGVYWHCHEIDCKHCNYPWRCMEKGDIVEWLKKPHHSEVKNG